MRFLILLMLVACGSDSFAPADATTDAPSDVGSDREGTPDGTASAAGCSDGTRETFAALSTYPNIAGCSGGFSVPSVTSPASLIPQCGRNAGNSSSNPNGNACSVEDLCALGWHVCRSAADVTSSGGTPCSSNGFGMWLTRQTTNDGAICLSPPTGANNLIGCGFGFGRAADTSCVPLDRLANIYDCADSGVWKCGSAAFNEADFVVKTGPSEGGVLCCKGL